MVNFEEYGQFAVGLPEEIFSLYGRGNADPGFVINLIGDMLMNARGGYQETFQAYIKVIEGYIKCSSVSEFGLEMEGYWKHANPKHSDTNLKTPKGGGVNMQLAESQGLSQEHVDVISELQAGLDKVLKSPENFGEDLKEAAKVVQGFEYVLQYFWKFGCTSKFHKYWTDIKGCGCPYLDNQEAQGTGRRIINMNCKVHGNGE